MFLLSFLCRLDNSSSSQVWPRNGIIVLTVCFFLMVGSWLKGGIWGAVSVTELLSAGKPPWVWYFSKWQTQLPAKNSTWVLNPGNKQRDNDESISAGLHCWWCNTALVSLLFARTERELWAECRARKQETETFPEGHSKRQMIPQSKVRERLLSLLL